MKRKLLLLLFALFLTACKEGKLTTEQKIYDKLANLETYSTSATVEKISNKSTTTYETKEYYEISGKYRLEFISPTTVNGSIIIFDGKTVKQFNPRVNDTIQIEASDVRDEMLFGSFVKNYITANPESNQSSRAQVPAKILSFPKSEALNSAEEAAANQTVLESKIPGDNIYLATEKLWIDNQTLAPIKLIVYDKNGGERITVTYKDFSYNETINEDIFKAE